MAILNERDYRAAKLRLEQVLRHLSPQGVLEGIFDQLPADVAVARAESLKAESVRLTADLRQYESLRSGDADTFAKPADLGALPILARIARKLSQKELADRLGLREQQIQRYEQERYAGIGLARYEAVLEALGVDLRPYLKSDVGKPSPTSSDAPPTIDPSLLRIVKKRNWISGQQSSDQLTAALNEFLKDAAKLGESKALHKRSVGQLEAGTALDLWHARVTHLAEQQRAGLKGKFNIADLNWITDLVKLSVFPDGPLRAIDLLRRKGIIVVLEEHLPGTLLDGAAFKLRGGIPVIALTLRHDRLDNFWFTLLHELAHVFLHLNGDDPRVFFDNLDEEDEAELEKQADGFARTRLIPDERWAISPARFSDSAESVRKFASVIGVHPAIVAGRIQRERNNYRVFSVLLGRSQVRELLNKHRPQGERYVPD